MTLEGINAVVTLLSGAAAIVGSGIGGMAMIARSVVVKVHLTTAALAGEIKAQATATKSLASAVLELRDDARERDARINDHGEEIAALKVAGGIRRRRSK